MDISNFISWFLNQVRFIFTWVFSTLDNIQFLGTSLLKFILIIFIISVLIPIILTISKSSSSLVSRSERYFNSKGGKNDK